MSASTRNANQPFTLDTSYTHQIGMPYLLPMSMHALTSKPRVMPRGLNWTHFMAVLMEYVMLMSSNKSETE